ncbi:hypothetical protein VM98_33545, partial [Streptomyces rubellomurinus subsp. indigoferus]
RWIGDGTVAAVAAAKRADAAARLELTREVPGGRRVLADRCSYFAWWRLAPPWRAETLVAAAARAGPSVTPAAAFAVYPPRSPTPAIIPTGHRERRHRCVPDPAHRRLQRAAARRRPARAQRPGDPFAQRRRHHRKPDAQPRRE